MNFKDYFNKNKVTKGSWGPGQSYLKLVFEVTPDSKEWYNVITDMINNYQMSEEEAHEILVQASRAFINVVDKSVMK